MTGDLLTLASELAWRESGRPKSVSLRKATSCAYYALFHALAALCAEQLVGNKPWSFYSPVYRSLDHSKAKNVLDAARRRLGASSALSEFALAFSTLQEARHDADYNPEPFRFDRSETVQWIEAAKQAVNGLSTLPADAKLDLAVQLLVKQRSAR